MSLAQDGDPKEMTRIEAFSDGVFAIAVTLLVLELKVPHLDEGATSARLARALLDQWPSYAAFLTSFATILVMWINHHGVFKLVRRPDSLFMFANGFLLLFVTVVPFPTALVAAYLTRSGADVAVAVYCGTYVMLSIAYNLLWRAASHRRRLLKASVTDEQVRRIGRNYLLGLPVYLAATMLAFVNAYAAMAVCSSLWILWARMSYEKSDPSASRVQP